MATIDKKIGLVIGPQGPQGPQGNTGPQGATGATGATPNLTIGTVTTLEPDASATATITGTAENPVLNLGLPKGQTGEVTEEEFTQLKEEYNNITDAVRTAQLIDEENLNIVKGTVNAQNTIVSSANSILYIPIESGNSYCISRTQKIGRFVVYLFSTEPGVGSVAKMQTASSTDYGDGDYITISSSLIATYSATYLAVYIRNNTVDASYTETQLIHNLMIQVGTMPTSWQPYYKSKIKTSAIDLDNLLDESSDNPVKNRVIASAINRLQDDMGNIESNYYVSTLWQESDFEDGTMSTTSGGNVASDYRIRMKDRYTVPFNMTVKNAPGYTLNIFKYVSDEVTNTGYPETDVETEYQLTEGENVRIVISRYPLSTDTNVSDYIGLVCVGVTQFQSINNKIKDQEKEVGTTAQENELHSNAEFFRTEDITYLGTKYFVGENGDYQTINAALTAWANDNYPPAVVFIENGEYNETIFVENKTIAFIGESKDGTIIRTKSGNYSFPPFKIHHGYVLVANLTAIADHTATPDFAYVSGSTMAYAFHIDGGSVGGEVIIRNCRAVSYQSPAFGMGLIPDSTIRLEDVESYTYTDDTTNSGVSLNNGSILCHLADNTLYPTPGVQTLQLVNVRAYSKNTTRVVVLPQGDSPTTLQLTAINLITADGKNGDGNSNIILPTKYALSDLCYGNSASKLN